MPRICLIERGSDLRTVLSLGHDGDLRRLKVRIASLSFK